MNSLPAMQRKENRSTFLHPDERNLIVHVPSMLPDEEHPYWGIFMRAHIDCAQSAGFSGMCYYAHALSAQNLRHVARQEHVMRESDFDGSAYEELRRCYKRQLGWQIFALKDFLSWVSSARERITLLHAHGSVWAGIWCAIAGRRYNIPVLVTEHSSGFPRQSYPYATRRVVRLVLPRVTALLPVTKNLGAHLRQYAPLVPQHVVPNCVNHRRFAPAPLPRPLEPLRILYVGSFVQVKRVDLLLQACAILRRTRSIRLRLVGTGPLREQLQRQAAQLGLEGCTTFVGQLSPSAVRDEMRAAHLVALSSEWESQPCVLIEAMLSGRPVVAPEVGGIPEMVHSDSGVLFEAGSSEDLARAMEQIAQSLSGFDPQATAGCARQGHSYESVGRQLGDLYQRYASLSTATLARGHNAA